MALCKYNHGSILDGVAANATAATRTAILSSATVTSPHAQVMQRARKVGLCCKLVRNAASDFVISVYKSHDNGTTWALVPAMRSNGDGSYEALTYTAKCSNDGAGLAADAEMYLTIDMEDADALKIIASATSGGASDLITVGACTAFEV